MTFEGRGCVTALQAVAYVGDMGIVQLVLEKGADVNGKGCRTKMEREAGQYGTALQAASRFGRFGHYSAPSGGGSRCECSGCGTNMEVEGGEYGTPLQAASYFGKEDIPRLLLEKGADVNGKGGQYGTALQAACAGREPFNAQGGEYGPALRAAYVNNSPEIVNFLLASGADPAPLAEHIPESIQSRNQTGRRRE
ncbi:ankyrin repeat domain-containing protein [Mycena vulgaris]|nr:ankyrin repeat domain-containing protein [Mycena vulgaris]